MASLFNRSHAVHDDNHDVNARTDDGRADLASRDDSASMPSDVSTGAPRPAGRKLFRRIGRQSGQSAASSPVLKTVADQPIKDTADDVKTGGDGAFSPSVKTTVPDHAATDALNSIDDDNEDVYVPRISRRWVVLISIVVVALLSAGVWFTQHERIQQVFESNSVNDNGLGSSQVTPTIMSDTIMNDLNIPKYYQKAHTKLSKDEKAAATNASLVIRPTSSFGVLPSKKSNPDLTDDPAKSLNSDGTANPNYSYLTADNVFTVMQDDLERIINPVYGNWTSLQNLAYLTSDGSAVHPDAWMNLKDMYDPSVAATMTDASSARKVLPLYADWDQNSYGGEFKGKSYNDVIVGVVTDAPDCEFHIAGATNDHIDCTYKVTYTGSINGSNKSVVKTLKLHYKINYNDSSPDYSQRRVLLTSMEQQ